MNYQSQHKAQNDEKILQEMSIDRLYQYAEETPLIPKDEVKKSIGDHSGYASNIQKYCNSVSTQPDVVMKSEGLPEIVPTQIQARENSSYWLNELNPAIINIFGSLYSFCTIYGSLKEEEIIQLVDDIENPGGKETLKAVLYEFVSQTQQHQTTAKKTSEGLNNFYDKLQSDFRNFMKIKQDIDNKIGGSNGRIQIINKNLSDLKEVISVLDKLISAMAITTVAGFIGIFLGVLLTLVTAVGGITLVIGGIATTATGSVLLNQYRREREEASNKQKNLSEELKNLNLVSTVLQTLGDEFTALSRDNQKASGEAGVMRQCWQTLGTNLLALIDHVDSVKDLEKHKILIRMRLLTALTMTKELKDLAIKSQEHRILPIIPDKNLIRLWNLPRDWYKQPIDSRILREYVTAQRKLQRFRGYEYAQRSLRA